MAYSVKEIFYSLQGEGACIGRAAVFCRFSGCNLWNGREADRTKAVCRFCDTDFVGTNGVGGGYYTSADSLAKAVLAHWPLTCSSVSPYVICTGGEPLLQLDAALITELKMRDFTIAVETNGTLPAPDGLDWICVSPKADTQIVLVTGDELKLVFPQDNLDPIQFMGFAFQHFFLQPRDGSDWHTNLLAAVRYCLNYPQWRLSLQAHKLLGLS